MGNLLSGNLTAGVSVTTKWDGAPAIICGIDPADGKFFVGTKSVFAKDSKISKTMQDIDNLYGGGLAEKLKASLLYLPEVVTEGVLQGDLMFTNDKKNERINDESFITFRPNTITYAANPDTELGKAINRANLGIVFHTKYTGPVLSEMAASFNVTERDFKPSDDVWAERAEFRDITGAASMSGTERNTYDTCIRVAEGSLKQASSMLNQIQTGKKALEIDTEFLKFFNNYVKEGRPIPSVKQAYNDYMHHLGKEYDKVISKNKTLKAQEAKVLKFVQKIDFITSNEREFQMVIATYMNLQKAKMILVEKMKKISSLRLFVDRGGGNYEATTPEGFVAIVNDKATKLIDRLEFSKLNFTIEKIW